MYCTSIKLLLHCLWKKKTTETIAVDLLFVLVSLATWGGYHGRPNEGTEKVQWEESGGRFPKPPVSAVLVGHYRTYDHLVTTAFFCDKQLLCSSRKYPSPPHLKLLEIPIGRGEGQRPKFPRVGGGGIHVSLAFFPEGGKKFITIQNIFLVTKLWYGRFSKMWNILL